MPGNPRRSWARPPVCGRGGRGHRRMRLPVIFVCENNGIACSTDHATGGQQAVLDLSKRAVGYDMASYVVNGNDFFAVQAAMERLVKRARNGEGNRCGFLECQTHRAYGHTAIDPQVYRDPPGGHCPAPRRRPHPEFRAPVPGRGLAGARRLRRGTDPCGRDDPGGPALRRGEPLSRPGGAVHGHL